jgi:uncharacterized membrane protein YtjA (UPF0391 family)
MAYWAVAFMAMALAAAALRMTGIGGLSQLDAWALFLVGLLLGLMSLLLDSIQGGTARQEDREQPRQGRGQTPNRQG